MYHGIPDSTAQADKVYEPELPDYKALFSEQNDPDPEEIEDELETADLWADNTAIKQSVDHPTEQETTGDNNDITLLFPKLKQSHLRKLCTPLGIKPMIKGKWLSTAKIRELVQKQAHTQPQQFIQALQSKCPDIVRITA